MILHEHDSEAGPLTVLHLTREETTFIVNILSVGLVTNPEDAGFTLTLGLTETIVEPTEPIITISTPEDIEPSEVIFPSEVEDSE